jgi:hypothetical protein
MALSLPVLEALLSRFAELDARGTGFVNAAQVDSALRDVLRSSEEQDQALLLLLVAPEGGRVSYARLQDEVALLKRKPSDATPQKAASLVPQQELVFKVVSRTKHMLNARPC